MTPDPGAIVRFAELGQQFRKLWDETAAVPSARRTATLLQALGCVLTEADALVQQFNEDFRYWESEP